MRNFKIAAETAIQTGKAYDIPEEYTEAYCISKGISWIEYRAMPKHLLNKVLELWRLEQYAQKEANKAK